MGRRRRRRKIVLRPKRKLPEVFQCPRCGYNTVGVTSNREAGTVTVRCSYCGLRYSFGLNPYLHPVDYYSRFLDRFEEEQGETVEAEGGEIPAEEAAE